MKLPGKHVLVTGGSSGIGLALARQLVQRGANVTIVARSRDKLQAAVEELQQVARSQKPSSLPAPRVHSQAADVTDLQQITAAVKAAEQALGPVDVLIANAGAASPGHFHAQDISVFESSMRLNYLGVVCSLKAVYGGMVARNSGHICLISSVMGTMGFSGYSSYAPTKYAVKGLADCLRNELQGTGVSVSIAFPPDTDTPGLQHENLSKPQETKEISAISSVFTADKVAECIVKGLQRGVYTLPTPDIGLNLHTNMMQGIFPRGVLSTLGATFLGLLTPLIQGIHGVIFDRISRKHSQARFADLWAAGGSSQPKQAQQPAAIK